MLLLNVCTNKPVHDVFHVLQSFCDIGATWIRKMRTNLFLKLRWAEIDIENSYQKVLSYYTRKCRLKNRWKLQNQPVCKTSSKECSERTFCLLTYVTIRASEVKRISLRKNVCSISWVTITFFGVAVPYSKNDGRN